MASAHTLPLALDKCLRTGFFRSDDPGASGEIPLELKNFGICEVTTLTAEERDLPAPGGYAVGHRLIVTLKTDGGDLTITGAAANVVLDTAGDYAEFIVTDNNGTKVWRVVANTTESEQSATTVTRTTAASAADLVPVSGGADRTVKAATPIAVTGDISAYNETTLSELLVALDGFGLIDDQTTT